MDWLFHAWAIWIFSMWTMNDPTEFLILFRIPLFILFHLAPVQWCLSTLLYAGWWIIVLLCCIPVLLCCIPVHEDVFLLSCGSLVSFVDLQSYKKCVVSAAKTLTVYIESCIFSGKFPAIISGGSCVKVGNFPRRIFLTLSMFTEARREKIVTNNYTYSYFFTCCCRHRKEKHFISFSQLDKKKKSHILFSISQTYKKEKNIPNN